MWFQAGNQYRLVLYLDHPGPIIGFYAEASVTSCVCVLRHFIMSPAPAVHDPKFLFVE